jgi:hypothetical protein
MMMRDFLASVSYANVVRENCWRKDFQERHRTDLPPCERKHQQHDDKEKR